MLEDSETSAARAGAGSIVKALRRGEPAATVLAYAGEVNAGLLVLGRRGLGPVRELLLGSVSHKLVQSALCNCLIVP